MQRKSSYPASRLSETHKIVCAICLRFLQDKSGSTCVCQQAVFCHHQCQQQSLADTPLRFADLYLDNMDSDVADPTRFVLQAADLQSTSGSKPSSCNTAQKEDIGKVKAWTHQTRGCIGTIPPDTFGALASAERINAYGIMAPSGTEMDPYTPAFQFFMREPISCSLHMTVCSDCTCIRQQ
ncbi:hypothetical protein WJX77_000644 [Trebouxia sp. C0004]